MADFVLPVRELARQVVGLLRQRQSLRSPADELDEDVLRRILTNLSIRTGHDFSKYRRSTVLRRIARRLRLTKTHNLRDYYELLRDNADEAQALMDDLLISVIRFFRESEAFAPGV